MSAEQGAGALPVDALLPELLEQLTRGQSVVLSAPPGSGKTTRVPPALLESGLLSRGDQVVVVQPRRLAARAVARYMARRLGERVGETVGYKVRFDQRASSATRLLVVTEGILLRMLLSDPLLSGVGCVVLDEFHERSVQLDLCLAFLRETLEAREDLRLVVMSATLEAAPLCRYLGDAPLLEARARQHPLVIRHQQRKADPRKPLEQRLASALAPLLSELGSGGGDLLVFLPGASEIRRSRKVLAELDLPGDPELVPLMGALPAAEQDRALRPAKDGRQRVILATNIAETSLTVPGVRGVLDSGLRKRLRHDPRLGFDRLELGPVSKASARQRAGRAGRLGPGLVSRLYTEAEYASRPEQDAPEVTRLDLSPALLSLLSFSPGDPRCFPFLDPPPDQAIDRALTLLRLLGAVDQDRYLLTDLGRRMVTLPLHPRLGALLDAAHRAGAADRGALLCALLSERDPLSRDKRGAPQALPDGPSDLLYRAELLEDWERGGGANAGALRCGLDLGAARLVQKARDQIVRLHRSHWSSKEGAKEEGGSSDLGRVLLAGYPDRVCRRREPGGDGAVMVGGSGVRLDTESGVREAELFLALRVTAGRAGMGAQARVSMASAVEESWLEQGSHAHAVTEREEVIFDERRGAAQGVRRRVFVDLVLRSSTRGADPDPELVEALLATEADRRFDQVFMPTPEAQQLMARIMLAARLLPGPESWPDLSDAGKRKLLAAQCVGRHSFRQLKEIPWAKVLAGLLTHRQTRQLERELPQMITVPSGRQVALDYLPGVEPDCGPVLAVKLQEMFGLAETPKLCQGKLPLTLHLLAPNGRPAQITRDLRSFWNSSYALVRKDLRGRYPKHPWPEDPWSAKPSARTKRKP